MSYAAGEKVPNTGAYRIRHKRHRDEHVATIRSGEIFPFCQRCGGAVVFEFISSEDDFQPDHIGYDSDFMNAVMGIRSA